jgi:hypothetical protein
VMKMTTMVMTVAVLILNRIKGNSLINIGMLLTCNVFTRFYQNAGKTFYPMVLSTRVYPMLPLVFTGYKGVIYREW